MKEQFKQYYPLANTFLLLLLSLLFILFAFLPLVSVSVDMDDVPLTRYYPNDAITVSRIDLGTFPLIGILFNRKDATQVIEILKLKQKIAENPGSSDSYASNLSVIEAALKVKDPTATIDTFLKDCFSDKDIAKTISTLLVIEHVTLNTSADTPVDDFSSTATRMLFFALMFYSIGVIIMAAIFLFGFVKYVAWCVTNKELPCMESACRFVSFEKLQFLFMGVLMLGMAIMMLVPNTSIRAAWYLTLSAYVVLCIFLGEWKMKDTRETKKRYLLYLMRGSSLVSLIFSTVYLFSTVGHRLFRSALAIGNDFISAYTAKLLSQQSNPDYAGIIQSTKEYVNEAARKQLIFFLALSIIVIVLIGSFICLLCDKIALRNIHIYKKKSTSLSHLSGILLLLACAIVPLFFGVSSVQERRQAWETGDLEFIYDEYKHKDSDLYLEYELTQGLYDFAKEQQKALDRQIAQAKTVEEAEHAIQLSLAHQESTLFLRQHLKDVKTHQKASVVFGILSAILLIIPELAFAILSYLYWKEEGKFSGYGSEDEDDGPGDISSDSEQSFYRSADQPSEQSESDTTVFVSK